jgi:DNA helicase-2/ATP-dependent DNA helicase PcrA
MNLDNQQQQILDIKEGFHAVQAPAGCGKTEILTQRISKAIQKGIQPEEIVCLTFTNKAAAEMKDRSLVQNQSFDGFIGNIHNYCSEFLKRNNILSGSTTLMGEDDYIEIIEGLIKKNKTGYKVEKQAFIKYIMDLKRTEYGLNPIFSEEFEFQNRQLSSHAYKELYESYESIKSKFGFIDFDDLLTLTIFNLKKTTELVFNSFQWLQIDESQDLNPAQWEIIELISKQAKCIVYFGDYEQSIYSFLGTEEGRFFSLFSSEKVTPHYLSKNYRSSEPIIRVLNAFLKNTIQSNVSFSAIDSTSLTETTAFFRVIEVDGTVDDELSYVASPIVNSFLKTGTRTGVLCRNNDTADLCSDKLSEIGISCFKLSGKDVFKHKDIKIALAILTTLVNPFDILSWSLTLKNYVKKIELTDARVIIHKARNAGLLPVDLLQEKMVSQFEMLCSCYENERLVVFDTETTSLDTDNGEIIQIAAVELINGEVGRKFEVYIRPPHPIDDKIVELTKITNEKLQSDGISPSEAIKLFLNFLGSDCSILAHNLDYDLSILRSYVGRHTNHSLEDYIGKSLDSLVIAKLLYPSFPKYKLEYLLKALNLEGNNSHNAMDDVLATISLVHKMYFDSSLKRNLFEQFLEENKLIVQEFQRSFLPMYNYLQKQYFESISIGDIIDYIVISNDSQELLKREIYQALLRFIRKMDSSNGFKSLRMRLQDCLNPIKSLKESDLVSDDAKVVVSTVHKSKGLSFDNVVVVESVEDIYPNYRVKMESDPVKRNAIVAEDRRLFYVALSRARKNIVVTHHTTFITPTGRIIDKEMTPFLEPIEDYYKLENV